MEKKAFFRKKEIITRATRQPPLLPEEVKHVGPTDILGTSGMGKAMELWCEGWFLYSSPIDGGKKEIMFAHTHMRCSL